MAGVSLPEMSPWKPRSLTIPPNSRAAWIRLAAWEMWMGMLLCVVGSLGVSLILSSPHHIIAVEDLSNCYAPPPVAVPCARLLYRGGMLDAAFVALCGLSLVGVGMWLLWELWTAVEPKPITDDFLRLLDASFGPTWRNPLSWPWARLSWAYGFTLVGALLTATLGLAFWTVIASSQPTKVPKPQVDTSQSFHVVQ